MKVEIKVLPEAKEPYAVIYASEITPEIRRTAALLETKKSGVVSVMENERIIVLRPDEIYMVRVETKRRSYIPRRSGMTAASGFMNLRKFSEKDL